MDEHIPCPHLKRLEHGIYACSIYSGRPEQCRRHDFSFAHTCPIGCDVLDLHDANHLAAREHLIGESEQRESEQ